MVEFFIKNSGMNKKSQITIYFIAGILVLITVLSMFYIRGQRIKEQLEVERAIREEFERQVTEIKNYVETCVRDTASEGINKLGKNGGYIYIPEAIEYMNTSHWFLDSSNVQPTSEEIEIRLEEYIDNNVKVCVNLDMYRNRSFEIIEGDVLSDVEFATETVEVSVLYPFRIRKFDMYNEFDAFSNEYNIRFRRIFELASQIINKHFEQDFDVYQPLNLVDTGDFNVEYSEYNDDDKRIRYTIVDRTRQESGKNYVFNFASRYNLTKLIRKIDMPENSHLYPTLFDNTIYSPDRFVELYIRNGSRMNYKGRGISEIKVSQLYPNLVVMKDVLQNSIGEVNDTEIKTKWPVYNILPNEGEIDKKQELRIYWDQENNQRVGEVGILYMNESNWQPLNSIPVYGENYVYAYVDELTSYAAVDCGIQNNQDLWAEETLSPDWACFLDIITYIFGGFLLELVSVDYDFPSSWIKSNNGDECVTFTPTCDQDIIITKQEDRGTGECTLQSGRYEGGKEYTLCAKMQKCEARASNLCRSCSVKCDLVMK